jgi:hypothetical protein
MNDLLVIAFSIVAFGIVALTAINIILLRLVNKLWRDNEELQPPF